MKKIVYLLLLGLASCQQDDIITEVPKDDWSVIANTAGQIKGQVNIKFKELPKDLQIVTTRSGVDTDNGQLNSVIRQLGGTRLERVFPHAGKFEARTRKAGLHLWYQVSFDENIPTAEAMKALSGIPNVATVEPIYKGKTESVPLPYNDPYLPQQWHLYNNGSNGMLAGADISILDAWEIEKGKPEVIVNVVDSKVDVNHEDLKDNLWKNPGEYNQNPWGDNDGNGYQGDWHGIGANPINGLPDYGAVDKDDHGTHVAGILAAKNNNGVGICGVAGGDTPDNGVRIMCCPFNNGNPAASIKYGADHGAVICTNSWYIAGGSVGKVLQDAVNYFVTYAGIDEYGNQTGPMRGGIVFGSAGNDGVEPESHYPASLDNVIAVAALDPAFRKSGYSNYAEWVDIAAPGGGNGYGWQMWSCAIGNRYLELVGTSQATPVAAGVAALIVSKFAHEGLTPYEVEYRLKRGVKPIDDYNPEYKGKLGVGCVDALLALSDEPVNFLPVITAQKPIEGVQIIPYGSTAQYVYTVSDMEDGTDLDYVLEDPSKSITATKQDGTITLSVNNRNCIAGDHIVKLTVTDRGGLSSTTEFSIKLQPELLQEVELYPNPVVDIRTIRASMTFSGEMRACLYDASGNLVLERKVTASLHKAGELDLSKVDGGSYTLKLYCNNKTITKNIIKL